MLKGQSWARHRRETSRVSIDDKDEEAVEIFNKLRNKSDGESVTSTDNTNNVRYQRVLRPREKV
jgi:hypothetical protein